MDFDRLDKTIHEKSRLAILSLLAAPARSDWPFADLKAELKMSDGNLVTHLRTLHQAGYVAITKEVTDRPLTRYALTEKGRTHFKEYIDLLEQIIRQTRGL
ncbi:Winged helix DNA-binding domain-containing protein [Verrucomicrobium sp. GAS474]|uniref:transcriptional regulator n=1 Tax=Verrucomicrobium sp. GAS474 TaxID=1882831 RepID=UPI00087B3E43|nr:transcriptional regulator [Verrucomicrobium sp. GAS474]SDT93388.1 Winged helix DNA-binding domain-containing protein [Verrucomicrobium sp. GAS474]